MPKKPNAFAASINHSRDRGKFHNHDLKSAKLEPKIVNRNLRRELDKKKTSYEVELAIYESKYFGSRKPTN